MKFDPSIALGSMVHLVVLLICMISISWVFSKKLTRIEQKQNEILDILVDGD